MVKSNEQFNENWIIYNPLNIPEGNYLVTDIIYEGDTYSIKLDDEINFIKIHFDGAIQVFRVCPENVRMRTWGEVQSKYGDKFFFKNWFMYVVENSQLINWLHEESCGFHKCIEYTHYSLVTSIEQIDVVVSKETNVEIECLRI